jgi:integrase
VRLYQPTYRNTTGKKCRSRKWWVQFSIDGQRYRKPTGLRDRRAAELRAATIVKDAERRAAGDETHDTTRLVEPTALLVEYVGELGRRGRAPEHVKTTERRLRCMFAPVPRLQDMTPEKIRSVLAALTKDRSLTAKSTNGYRIALSGFFTWLVREGRWFRNPVAAVPRAHEEKPERERRALATEELALLFAKAPQERSTLYRFASTTGLRRSELRKLRWRDVDLTAGTVRVRAENAKNRLEAVLPLHPETVSALKELRGKAKEDDPVFAIIPPVATLVSDLERAGIAAKTDKTVVDLHALARVTFATALARADVPLVQAQKLMRHSDPKLTANIYTRLDLGDARAAVAKLTVPPRHPAGETPTVVASASATPEVLCPPPCSQSVPTTINKGFPRTTLPIVESVAAARKSFEDAVEEGEAPPASGGVQGLVG